MMNWFPLSHVRKLYLKVNLGFSRFHNLPVNFYSLIGTWYVLVIGVAVQNQMRGINSQANII